MDVIFSLLVLLWILKRRKNREKQKLRKRRKYKTRPVFAQRNIFGEMNLMRQVQAHDPEIFFKSFRMNARQFEYLLNRLQPTLLTGREHYCDAISPCQKLAMTIRFNYLHSAYT